ncbi:hypothetical protein ACEPPZ_06760 [Paracoccus yeei]|uniref:hypothetical protein n=1 Tax=Paracoccus yeei TaxID=147645 RepID=UPI0037D1AAF7
MKNVILPARPEVKQSELIAELNVSRVTFTKWRRAGRIPLPVRKIGREQVYSTAAVAEACRAFAEVRIV